MHQIIYAKEAVEDLERLEKYIAKRITDKIKFYASQKDPLEFAKQLINIDEKRYRFRIGDYRAVFRVENNGEIKILMILRIKHRKDIYHLG